MKRGEIKNIINKDWDKRQEKYKEKSKKNSQITKNWKTKEKLKLKSTKKSTPSTHKKPTATLSLLVAVTYAKDH